MYKIGTRVKLVRVFDVDKDVNIGITGIVVPYNLITTTRGFVPAAPSIDRINQDSGYTKDNIRVISWRANHIKNDATLEELEKIVAYVKGQKEI